MNLFFRCLYCVDSFTEEELPSHMKDQHPKEKPYHLCRLCVIEEPRSPQKWYHHHKQIDNHKHRAHPLPEGLPSVNCPHCQELLSDGRSYPKWNGHYKSGKCVYNSKCQWCEKFLEADPLKKWEIKEIFDTVKIKKHHE